MHDSEGGESDQVQHILIPYLMRKGHGRQCSARKEKAGVFQTEKQHGRDSTVGLRSVDREHVFFTTEGGELHHGGGDDLLHRDEVDLMMYFASFRR